MKKSKEANWSFGGSPLQFSSLKRLENVFVRSVIVIFFIIEKGFKLNAVKRFIIPYSQFLRLRRLCSEDSDFFDKRGYPASVVQAGHHRAKQIVLQSALETSQKENNNRIPFTLTFHPHNHAVKSILLKNFKLL